MVKREGQKEASANLIANSLLFGQLQDKLGALAASCRLYTNFDLSIKNFMGCSACFTLEIICDIINQNKPVEKGVTLWQSI